jgi:methylmalonyl-CoA epimerase
MMKGIDHIGIAVRNLEETKKFFEEVLGLGTSKEGKAEKFRFAFIPVGDSEIELIEPIDPSFFIAKFIAQRGEGIHHVALKVEGIEEALEKLRRKGIRPLDEKPRIGVHGVKIAFIDYRGIIVELCESDQ